MFRGYINPAFTAFAVVAALLLNSACKHDPLECDPKAIVYERDIQPIFSSNCAMSGCHDPITREEGIDLSSYDAMMASDDVIDTETPMSSELLEVITAGPNDNDRMPPDLSPPLSQEQIQKIEIWLSMGAKNEKCIF